MALAAVVLLAGACTEDAPAPSEASATSEQAAPVPVTEVGGGLADDCAAAADFLGIAVPCPTSLPVSPDARWCGEDSQGVVADLPACVAQAGGDETLDTIFSLDVEGYETNSTVAHLIVEARRVERAPGLPCYRGTPAPSIRAGARTLRVLDCSEKDEGADAIVRHGEGAHYGHLLGYWDEAGVRYVVSVHDQSTTGLELLKVVASGISLTAGS